MFCVSKFLWNKLGVNSDPPYFSKTWPLRFVKKRYKNLQKGLSRICETLKGVVQKNSSRLLLRPPPSPIARILDTPLKINAAKLLAGRFFLEYNFTQCLSYAEVLTLRKSYKNNFRRPVLSCLHREKHWSPEIKLMLWILNCNEILTTMCKSNKLHIFSKYSSNSLHTTECTSMYKDQSIFPCVIFKKKFYLLKYKNVKWLVVA